VADDVHPLVPGGLAGLLDELGQADGGAADVLREGAVVQGEHLPEAASAQGAAQQREHRAVVHQAVHQQDGRAGGHDVAEQQPAGGRAAGRRG
jgi:hypothetical protein